MDSHIIEILSYLEWVLLAAQKKIRYNLLNLKNPFYLALARNNQDN